MCYDCEEYEAGRPLTEPFRFSIPPVCADQAGPDDVVRPGALEDYWAGLLRDSMEAEVQAAQERGDRRRPVRIVIARSFREAQGFSRAQGWTQATDHLVFLTDSTPFGDMNALRGLHGPGGLNVYRVAGAVAAAETESYLRYRGAREWTSGAPRGRSQSPLTPVERMRQASTREESERVARELMERHGYAYVVDEAGQLFQNPLGRILEDGLERVAQDVIQGMTANLEVRDEAVEMSLETLQEWVDRLRTPPEEPEPRVPFEYGGIVPGPDGRIRVSFVPSVANPDAPTAEEVSSGYPLVDTNGQEITFYRDPYRPFHVDRNARYVLFMNSRGEVRQGELSTEDERVEAGRNWRQRASYGGGPGNSSGMPFSWASTFERHPGWSGKEQTLTVYSTPYGQDVMTYRRDELEEDVRWF